MRGWRAAHSPRRPCTPTGSPTPTTGSARGAAILTSTRRARRRISICPRRRAHPCCPPGPCGALDRSERSERPPPAGLLALGQLMLLGNGPPLRVPTAARNEVNRAVEPEPIEGVRTREETFRQVEARHAQIADVRATQRGKLRLRTRPTGQTVELRVQDRERPRRARDDGRLRELGVLQREVRPSDDHGSASHEVRAFSPRRSRRERRSPALNGHLLPNALDVGFVPGLLECRRAPEPGSSEGGGLLEQGPLEMGLLAELGTLEADRVLEDGAAEPSPLEDGAGEVHGPAEGLTLCTGFCRPAGPTLTQSC